MMPTDASHCASQRASHCASQRASHRLRAIEAQSRFAPELEAGAFR